jgi:hypothetical protein
LLDDYYQKTARLVRLLREQPCLVVLDNVETVLKAKKAKRAGFFSEENSEYSWLFHHSQRLNIKVKLFLPAEKPWQLFQV